MTIAVIGCGFVGSAVADFLEKHLVAVHRVDPQYYSTTIQEVRESCEAFVVCVPTPSKSNGSCDDTVIASVIDELDTEKPILLKSTVTPDLLQNYPNNLTYNPEFLRAAYAQQDFENQELFILGGNNQTHMDFWQQLFERHLKCRFIRTNRTTASMIKYTHNAWLATKVAFFHEVFENAPADMNYSMLTSTLAQMPNIGPSHMIVPNDQGHLGYSGHCFPKDVKALTSMIDHSILEQVITTNQRLNKRSIK